MLLITTKGSLHRVKIKSIITFHLFMQTMIIILLGVHAYRGAIGGVSKQLLDRRHGRGLRCKFWGTGGGCGVCGFWCYACSLMCWLGDMAIVLPADVEWGQRVWGLKASPFPLELHIVNREGGDREVSSTCCHCSNTCCRKPSTRVAVGPCWR